jgi:hypothetical protein
MKSMTTDKTDLETRLVALRDSLGRVVTRDEVEPCLWTCPGLVDTQLSPSKAGVGVFNASQTTQA